MKNITETEAWADAEHAKVFDYLHKRPGSLLKRHYESFNEGRLLNEYKREINGQKFYEIGCATGELYRYLSLYHKRFQYTGFDISKPALARAISKFPDANFHLLQSGIDSLVMEFGKADVIWCRDVVLHQKDPYAFLDNLMNSFNELLILRLRTREKGKTSYDSDSSCQLHWDKHWVPYIILNTDELIMHISKFPEVKKIIIARRFEVLGGQNFRFLPKDMYFRDTGTAETAVLVFKGERHGGKIEIVYSDRNDAPKYSYFERLRLKLSTYLR